MMRYELEVQSTQLVRKEQKIEIINERPSHLENKYLYITTEKGTEY